MLLKTILVKLKGSKGEFLARLFFDEGSQLSYITFSALNKIGSNPVCSEWTRNIVFGGALTEPREVSSHEIEVCTIDNSFSTKLILRETPAICGIRICVGS